MNKTHEDNYKLDTPDYSDEYECHGCNDLFTEEELTELLYIDADGDRKLLFLCGSCVDRINQGDV